MSTSPAYLAGRVTGLLVRPLLPLAESALAGVLDGLFGEPDEPDASYTPTPSPFPSPGYSYDARVHAEWLESIAAEVDDMDPHEDPTWTLDRDRIDEIRGDAA